MKNQGRLRQKSQINPNFEHFEAQNDLFLTIFWSKSDQFENDKKAKMSKSAAQARNGQIWVNFGQKLPFSSFPPKK